ncbi:hypothetical protein NMY22_g15130 [Coprinellus aureogranulatus]|nr:hypothetical protein NMY22_g15130 [Coprinellus aureogranulatus]
MNALNLAATLEEEFSFQVINADQTIALRHLVLWPNAPISQVLLPEDNAGIHIGAFIPSVGTSEPIAVISLFQERPPTESDDKNSKDVVQPAVEASSPSAIRSSSDAERRSVRFRKFACHPSYQGRGVGSNLLRYAAEIAKGNLGGSVIWCDARVSTAPWYRKRGLIPFGNVFYKSDVQYVRMKRDL